MTADAARARLDRPGSTLAGQLGRQAAARQAERAPRPAAPPAKLRRSGALDAFRGLAVAFMIVDHVALLVGGPVDVLRLIPGRLAFPMFFVLAGVLAGRWVFRRHGLAIGAGLSLPLLVPWIDSPNVLVLWSLGVALLALMRRFRIHPVLLIAVVLASAANGYVTPMGYYDPASAWALMALGVWIRQTVGHDQAFGAFGELPGQRVWQWLGRWALPVYVWHLLGLQVIVLGIRGWYP